MGAELVKGEEGMYLCLDNLRPGTHMPLKNDVCHSQCCDRCGTQRHISGSSSSNGCTIHIWRYCCIESPCYKSVFGEKGTLPCERYHCIACYGMEYAYHS